MNLIQDVPQYILNSCKLTNNLPFRRTGAQKKKKACKIDVNKASRLYSAFTKIGLLKDGSFLFLFSMECFQRCWNLDL